MKRFAFVLVVVVLVTLLGFQKAGAVSIIATPKTPDFGPNDWIVVHIKINGYNGGSLSWTALRPDNSTISGVLKQVKPDGTITQQIVRNAFDNYFGKWIMTYHYDNTSQAINFTVNPIILTVSTDKDVYYEPDVMHVNITTSYYNPVAEQAEFFHLNFYDQGGNAVTDIPQIDIRAFRPSIVYNYHMIGLADYHPPGLYRLKVQYYNTVKEVPFLLGKYREFMSIYSKTDKNTYLRGDVVNLEMLFTRVTQTEGTIKLTDPTGNVTTRQFQVFSIRTPLVLNGITSVVGNYSYQIQYGGVSQSGSFTVIQNPKPLPNITFGIFPDKMYYNPGDVAHVRVYASSVVASSIDLWAVNPSGVEYPRGSFPVTATDTTLMHKIGYNYTTGKWELYADYDGIVKSVPFYVQGPPVNDNEILNPDKYSMPSFVSYFGTNSSLNAPSGISIDSDGNVYVVDSGNAQIKKFDPSGKLLLSWGSEGSGKGQFLHPSGIVAGKKYVYIADTGNSRIEMFDRQGNYIYSWGGYGNGHGLFHTPVSLAEDIQGDLFVADSGLGTIQIFNSERQYSGEIKSLETLGANFTGLEGISFDQNNYFYVSSTDDKILKFSDIGRFVNFFGSTGTEMGRFASPTAIAVDSKGRFYVADTNNHRIQKFDSYGNYLVGWASLGKGPGMFEEPAGLAGDSFGNIYVTDKKNDNIQKFSLYGGKNSVVIPSWVRENIYGWSLGELHRDDFALAIRFMMQQGLVNAGAAGNLGEIHAPLWLKNVALWWAQGRIDDDNFASSIQFLISNGMLGI